MAFCFEYTARWAEIAGSLLDGPRDRGIQMLEERDRELEAAFPCGGGSALAPTASLSGGQTLTNDFSDTGLTASVWRQSPGMDPFVTVDAANVYGTGHRFVVLAPCDLLLTYSFEINRGGSTGETFAGVTCDHADGTGGDELFSGSWANSAFPSSTQWVGYAQARTYFVDSVALTPAFSPHAFIGLIGSNRPVAWKLSLTLIETTTARSL